MISSYARGHEIKFIDECWIYADTRKTFDDSRPCIRCGKPPDKNGHDACMGYLAGVVSACCGHGVSAPILIAKCEEKV